MVRVVLPSVLAAQAQGRQRFEVDAQTVGDALRALPVADLLFNERGECNPFLFVYVDGAFTHDRGGLAYPLAGAKELRVVAVRNGC